MFALLTIVCVGLTAYAAAQDVNLARQTGVTCSSSSTFSAEYSCTEAYDGVTVPGRTGGGNVNEWAAKAQPENNWIQLNFPKRSFIKKIVLFPRCHKGDQNTNIEVATNCGKKFQLTRKCNGTPSYTNCKDINGETIEINAFADDVKITGTGKCTPDGKPGNVGYREVQVFGVVSTAGAAVDLARQAGVTCSASSSFSAEYGCAEAYDGVTVPGRTSSGNVHEWAAKAQPENNWIQLNFPKTVYITKIVLFPRCHKGDQNTNIEVETCGKKFQLTRKCNGTSSYRNCTGIGGETIEINTFADDVKITGTGKCTPDGKPGNVGYRAVQVFGVAAN